jgi:probable HAF family extracellular repeat protein
MRSYRLEDITDGLSYPDCYGLNSTDQVAGDSTGDGSSYAAFLERTIGNVTIADPPGAASAVFTAINDSGTAVGNWRDQNDQSRAYICDPNNRIIDLDSILRQHERAWARQSWAADINSRGVVVGGVATGPSWDPATIFHSFIYDASASPQVRFLAGFPTLTNSSASAINSRGEVVGTCFDTAQTQFRPYLYAGGNMEDFSGQPGHAFDINDRGHILGAQQDFIGSGGNSGPYIWAAGTFQWIVVNGLPSAINNNDQVVGSAMGADGKSFAFLYDTVVVDLNSLISPRTHLDVVLAYEINDNGHISAAGLDSGYAGHAVLLIPNTPSYDPRAALGLVSQILFGITQDGGGLAHLGIFPVPVDPWGALSETQIDTIFARTTSLVELQLKSDPVALKVAVESIQKYRRKIKPRRNK